MLGLSNRSCYPYASVPPRRTIRRLEARLPSRRNRLALLLRAVPSLRLRQPHRVSHPRLRQSDHPRRRPFLLQLVRRHHQGSRWNTGRTPRACLVRPLFLLATRSHRLHVLRLLVLRKFSLHRRLHGRRPHRFIAACRLGRLRLGNSLHPVGPPRPRPENRRHHAYPRLSWHARHHRLACLPTSQRRRGKKRSMQQGWAVLISSIAEQRLNITAGAYYMKNQDVLIFNPIEDDVFACEETSQARTQIFIAASSDVGITGKKEKPPGDGIDHAVRNLDAA